MPAKKMLIPPNTHIVAAFLSGMVVATAGWFFSDRLDIAFGQSSDINLVANGKGWQQICEPGMSKKERKVDGCNVVISEEKCIPMQKHYQVTRTWTGRHISELASPNRRSTAVTTYENSKSETRKNIKQEMNEYMQQMREKRGTELTNLKKEYDNLSTQARLNRCQTN